MPTGAERIAAERERQVVVEGYTAEHDEDHWEELIAAADAYVDFTTGLHVHGYYLTLDEAGWPWHHTSWKPTGDPVQDLTKAGALIAAAIDSLEGTQ